MARSSPLEECIKNTCNIEFHYHGDAWIEEVISRGFKKINVRCFNFGKQGYLKWNCKKGIPRNNVFSKSNQNTTPLLSGSCGKHGKGRHSTNKCRSTRNSQSKPLPLGNILRGLSQALNAKFSSVTVG